MRIVTCLLAFLLLRSDGAGPDLELIVQQVMMMKTGSRLTLMMQLFNVFRSWMSSMPGIGLDHLQFGVNGRFL